MPRIGPVELQMRDEPGHEHDVPVAMPGDLIGDLQAVADRVVRPARAAARAPAPISRTVPTNRYPRPCTVRMSRWGRPSSPTACRTCLIRLVTAPSLTNRPTQTLSISSSLVTTWSRWSTRCASTSKTWGSNAPGRRSAATRPATDQARDRRRRQSQLDASPNRSRAERPQARAAAPQDPARLRTSSAPRGASRCLRVDRPACRASSWR